MDHQRPDPENGSTHSGARVEDDFVQPLRPLKSASHRRLPAALPFALAGLLVVTSIAFGATFARNLVSPQATAIIGGDDPTPIVGGDDPTDTPNATAIITDAPLITDAPTATPTATPTPTPTPTSTPTPAPTARPTPAPTAKPTAKPVDLSYLGSLNFKDNGDGTYTFSWAAYKGSKDYDYYKLDGQADPTKPGFVENGGHYWDGGCVNPGTTSVTVAVGTGTWNFKLEAVTVDPNVLIAQTSSIKLVVAPVTAPPVLNLTLDGHLDANGNVVLDWSKYTGPYFQWYGIQRTSTTNPGTPAVPTLTVGGTPHWYTGNVNTITLTDNGSVGFGSKPALGKTYSYMVWAYTEKKFSVTGVQPACYLGTLVAVSNVFTIVIK